MRLGNHPICSFALRENDFQLTVNAILIYLFIFKCILHKEQKQNLNPHRNVTMDMPMSYVEDIGMDFIYFFPFHSFLSCTQYLQNSKRLKNSLCIGEKRKFFLRGQALLSIMPPWTVGGDGFKCGCLQRMQLAF